MFLNFQSFGNSRSGSVLRRAYRGARRRQTRVAPRLVALEVRALLSTITVTNDADSGVGSLRQALASSVAGDTIQFARSAYGTIALSSGPLEVATSVTIDGPGAKNLTINGENTFQDLQVQASVTARVSGLTITGGEGPTGYPYAGGGIFNAGTLTVADCVVTKNSAAGDGGGIANSGSLTVTGSVVSDNTAGIGGGINSIGTLVVENSTITDNSGGFGGGISSYQGAVSVTNCVVSGNAGGGVVNTGAAMSLTNCDVTGNTTFDSEGGYGIQGFGDDLNVTNCVVSGNNGGIAIGGGGSGTSIAMLTVTNSSIINNSISSSSDAVGGGIVSNSGDVTISGSLIADNSVSSELPLGGGIAMETFFEDDAANVLTVSNTTFMGNQAIGTGSFGQGYGGAIHTDAFATVSLTNCAFINNSASGSDEVQGGALDLQGLVKGTITGCQFTGNQAVVLNSSTIPGPARGGAIANTGEFSDGSLSISGSTFTNNRVQGGPGGGLGLGGAIINQELGATLKLSSSNLLNNSAIGGAGPTSGSYLYGGFGAGGGLNNFLGADATVSGSSFVGNTATGGAETVGGGFGGFGEGGGIANQSASLSVSNSNFVGNVAKGGAGSNGALGGPGFGGGIQNDAPGAVLTVDGGTIIGNFAIGGAGGGPGEGGGVYSSGSAAFSGVLIALNSAIGGSGGGQGVGGGLYVTMGTLTLTGSTKVLGNFATTSNDNIYG